MENGLMEQNKWMMNQAGVLNYWYYKYEVFPFDKGHLIIKGANGTGKSVTTQSFLPLLLDGNKQPSRLDPFGSRSRKMIDYIFGENPDVSEKTCYLFLEYKKKHSDEYITTGIGFKANLATGKVDSWHFLLKNKRIGRDVDLFKYQLDEVGEKVMVPLSRKELENYVDREKCGYVKEKQKDYAELVNKYIFKFETLEDYLEMVNLVVRIRTPKLSNELGPSVIYQILERSLPELSFNDLRSLTETIQNIDEHNKRLTETKESFKLIKSLSAKYQDYNKNVLSQKATDYVKTSNKRKSSEKEHKKAQDELAKVTHRMKIIEQEIGDFEAEQERIEEKLRNFEDNDIRKAQRRLTEQSLLLQTVKEELASHDDALDNKKSKRTNLGSQIKSKDDELYELTKKNRLITEDLDETSQDVDFNSHELHRDNYLSQSIEYMSVGVVDQWRETFDGHEKTINDITKLLYREHELKTKLDEKDAELQKLDDEERTWSVLIQKLQEKLEEAIGSFNQDITDWNDQNDEFILNKEQLSELVDVIHTLFEETGTSDVDEFVRNSYAKLRDKLILQRAHYEADVKVLDGKIQAKHSELEIVQNKKEPEPIRNEQTIAVRRELKKEGILFASFYETVDFKNNVSEEEKERLESALSEMGVLDGLIVQKEYIHRVTESDSILLPQAVKEGERTLSEYLDVNLQEEYSALTQQVKDILNSISIEVGEQGTYVTNFGLYQHGVVKGYAVITSAASFIGKEARAKYRANLIQKLETDLNDLLTVKEELELLKEENAASTQTLLSEKDKFPSMKEIKEINREMEEGEREKKTILELKGRIEKGIQNLRTDYNATRSERVKKSEGRKLKPQLDAYEEAKEQCKKYLQQLNDLKMNGKDFNMVKHSIDSLNNQIEDIEDDIDELSGQIGRKEKNKKKVQEVIAELEDFLSKEGISDIENEIKEIEERKAEIPKVLRKLEAEKGGLTIQIPEMTKTVGFKETGISFYRRLEKIKGDVFVKEMNKKFIETFDHDSLSNEEDIEALTELVVEEFGETTHHEVTKKREELVVVLRDVSLQGLEEFLPTSSTDTFSMPKIGDEGYEVFAKEIEELYISNERIIISLTHDSKTASPMLVQKELEMQIDIMQASLRAEDEKMYKEIIVDKIGERIRELISKANKWKASINKLMSERETSSGLKLSIEWNPREAKELDEIKTSELIRLLQRDPGTLKDSDFNKLTKHFTSKIQYAKDLYEEDEDGKEKSLDYVIKDVLDYRKWFEFKINFSLGDENKKELTKNRFNALSGGERAMSMYIPLLSALFSKYSSASKEAPYIISMDEAFAGVDENNIRDMFELMGNLDLNYILNSQSLWGDYDTVDNLSIAEIIRPKNSKDVTVVHFKWDGKRMLPREIEEIKPIEKEKEVILEPSKGQQNMFDFLSVE